MSKIINISDAVSIAIHSLAIIARNEEIINGEKISDLTGFSRNHTAKIMQILVKHGLLTSERGPKGGFQLNKPATDIFLMEVYQLIEGEFRPDYNCLHDRLSCPFNQCVFGDISQKMAEEFKKYLMSKTINDLIK